MSRYALFRRRLAPIAVLLAIGLVAHEQCTKMKRTHATVVLDFGDAAAKVVAVEAEVKIGDDSAAIFHREAHPPRGIGPCKFELALPVDDAELQVDIDLGARQHRVNRHLHLEEGATLNVPLAQELATP